MRELGSIQRRESLVVYAKAAGIPIPDDLYASSEDFPHWNLFCNVQIERPIFRKDAPLFNAQVIAAVPIDKLCSIAEPFRFEEISSQLK